MIPTEFWSPEADDFCHGFFKGDHCTHCSLGWMDRLIGGYGDRDPMDRSLTPTDRRFITDLQIGWRDEAEAMGLVKDDFDIAIVNDNADPEDLEQCFKGALARVGYRSHNGTNLYRREATT